MTKIYSNMNAPEGEQRICVTCGFCCDATIFLQATLQHGEKGRLPKKIDDASHTEDGKDYFHLPCGYFSGSCTIYDRQRAQICSTFRCQLLKRFDEGRVSQEDAIRAVRKAAFMRDAILTDYRNMTGKEYRAGFRRLLVELGRLIKEYPAGKVLPGDFEMLLARCNILEALLIKAFLPSEEFDKYIMK